MINAPIILTLVWSGYVRLSPRLVHLFAVPAAGSLPCLLSVYGINGQIVDRFVYVKQVIRWSRGASAADEGRDRALRLARRRR